MMTATRHHGYGGEFGSVQVNDIVLVAGGRQLVEIAASLIQVPTERKAVSFPRRGLRGVWKLSKDRETTHQSMKLKLYLSDLYIQYLHKVCTIDKHDINMQVRLLMATAVMCDKVID